MTSRNLVKFFLTTLVMGGLTTGVLGYILRWHEFAPYIAQGKILSAVLSFVWLVGVGFIFSLISQVGYFAYLTIHQFGLGISRSLALWNAIQIVFILFALFDLVYFRFEYFGHAQAAISSYLILPAFIVAAGLIVSTLKYKQSKNHTFIPALFFMIVFTIVELVPVLRVNKSSWVELMTLPLLLCNGYQMLILAKFLKRSEEERALSKLRYSVKQSGENPVHK
ncbi:KinB-signaling pathway activation protein [Heyndrickxia acidicola]|uniref:KinB-signaling pathway activation protein n=1 Tax=Heyndrickxia acidicola TaxID=209389 RepID=A0ABU6MMT8_9BACI|nr:KinB-signaling pathway activation protein [Heyndrickxia acidicola]MED1205619.1 KinB-signaling pathway activation protein [Heyndrickxia acidicola]